MNTAISPEQGPQFRVTFFGINHDQMNVQIESEELGQLRRTFAALPGRHTILLEDNATPSSSRYHQTTIEVYGGYVGYRIASHLLKELKRDPTMREVAERKSKLQELDPSKDLQIAIDQGLVDTRKLRDYYLAIGLDELSQDFDFKVIYESHDQKVRRDTDRLRETYRGFQHKMNGRIAAKDFPGAIANYRLARRYLDLLGERREVDLTDQWRNKIKDSIQKQEKGTLFISMGAAHRNFLDKLKQRLDKKLPISYEEIITMDTDSPFYQLGIADSLSNQVPDELFARTMLVGTLIPEVEHFAKTTGQLAEYAYNYETFFRLFSRIANNLSYQEIQETMIGEVPIIDFLISHPFTQESGLIS